MSCRRCGRIGGKFIKKNRRGDDINLCFNCYQKRDTHFLRTKYNELKKCSHTDNGICKLCYNHFWRQNSKTICGNCGNQCKRSLHPICGECKSRKGKVIINEQQLKTIKLLMTKAKWNLINSIDEFRLIDLYLSVGLSRNTLLRYSTPEDTLIFITQTFRSILRQ